MMLTHITAMQDARENEAGTQNGRKTMTNFGLKLRLARLALSGALLGVALVGTVGELFGVPVSIPYETVAAGSGLLTVVALKAIHFL